MLTTLDSHARLLAMKCDDLRLNVTIRATNLLLPKKTVQFLFSLHKAVMHTRNTMEFCDNLWYFAGFCDLQCIEMSSSEGWRQVSEFIHLSLPFCPTLAHFWFSLGISGYFTQIPNHFRPFWGFYWPFSALAISESTCLSTLSQWPSMVSPCALP